MVVLIALMVVLAIIFLPKLIETFGSATEDSRTVEEKREDKIDSDRRGDKGALCNTFDFFVGEGACDERFGEKTPDEVEVDITEKGATDKVKVEEKEPVITSTTFANTDTRRRRGR